MGKSAIPSDRSVPLNSGQLERVEWSEPRDERASDYIQEIERLEPLERLERVEPRFSNIFNLAKTLERFELSKTLSGLGVPGGMALHRQALGHRLLLGVP